MHVFAHAVIAALFLSYSFVARAAQPVPNEDIGYILTVLPNEGGDFCRSVKGMANFHRKEAEYGLVDDPKLHGEFCDTVFKEHKATAIDDSGRYCAISERMHRGPECPNLNPVIDGKEWNTAMRNLRSQQGRILVCELFWFWGGENFGFSVADELNRAGNCDQFDVATYVKKLLVK